MNGFQKILHGRHKFHAFSKQESETFCVDTEQPKEEHFDKYITFPIKCKKTPLSTKERALLMKQKHQEFAQGIRADFEMLGFQNVVVVDEDDWFPEIIIQMVIKKIKNLWNYYFNRNAVGEQ